MMINLNQPFEQILQTLINNVLDSKNLFDALEEERAGQKRKEVIYSLCRKLDGNISGLEKRKILIAVKAAETRRRRRIVNKIYKETTIWAMEEIRKIYPDYSEEMLIKDLRPAKKRKGSSHGGFRFSQIWKLWDKIKLGDDPTKVNKYYHMLSNHLNNYKKPIRFEVHKSGKAKWYIFSPKIEEQKVKAFITGLNNCKNIQEVDNLYSRLFIK